MANLGRNLKIEIDTTLRGDVRRFYEEGLGCARRSPRDTLDLFDFEDGGCFAVFYVDGGALDAALWAKAVWLEFLVDDAAGVADTLVALGGARVKGATDHPYILAPGGPIFRLAPKG